MRVPAKAGRYGSRWSVSPGLTWTWTSGRGYGRHSAGGSRSPPGAAGRCRPGDRRGLPAGGGVAETRLGMRHLAAIGLASSRPHSIATLRLTADHGGRQPLGTVASAVMRPVCRAIAAAAAGARPKAKPVRVYRRAPIAKPSRSWRSRDGPAWWFRPQEALVASRAQATRHSVLG